jgi:hypothetical protein
MFSKIEIKSINKEKLDSLLDNVNQYIRALVKVDQHKGHSYKVVLNRAVLVAEGTLYQCQTLCINPAASLYFGYLVRFGTTDLELRYIGTYRRNQFLAIKG